MLCNQLKNCNKMEDDKIILKKLYSLICKECEIKEIPLYFKKVGRGGACCSYIGSKPISISIDLNRIACGSAYVLCHEVAHQIEIEKNNNHTHNYKWKKTFNDLRKKYENCKLAQQLIW